MVKEDTAPKFCIAVQFECLLQSEPTHSVVSFMKSSYCSQRFVSSITPFPVKTEKDAAMKKISHSGSHKDLGTSNGGTEWQRTVLFLFVCTALESVT